MRAAPRPASRQRPAPPRRCNRWWCTRRARRRRAQLRTRRRCSETAPVGVAPAECGRGPPLPACAPTVRSHPSRTPPASPASGCRHADARRRRRHPFPAEASGVGQPGRESAYRCEWKGCHLEQRPERPDRARCREARPSPPRSGWTSTPSSLPPARRPSLLRTLGRRTRPLARPEHARAMRASVSSKRASDESPAGSKCGPSRHHKDGRTACSTIGSNGRPNRGRSSTMPVSAGQ